MTGLLSLKVREAYSVMSGYPFVYFNVLLFIRFWFMTALGKTLSPRCCLWKSWETWESPYTCEAPNCHNTTPLCTFHTETTFFGHICWVETNDEVCNCWNELIANFFLQLLELLHCCLFFLSLMIWFWYFLWSSVSKAAAFRPWSNPRCPRCILCHAHRGEHWQDMPSKFVQASPDNSAARPWKSKQVIRKSVSDVM